MHLDPHTPATARHGEQDRSAPMEHRVGDQLGDQQTRGVQRLFRDPRTGNFDMTACLGSGRQIGRQHPCLHRAEAHPARHPQDKPTPTASRARRAQTCSLRSLPPMPNQVRKTDAPTLRSTTYPPHRRHVHALRSGRPPSRTTTHGRWADDRARPRNALHGRGAHGGAEPGYRWSDREPLERGQPRRRRSRRTRYRKPAKAERLLPVGLRLHMAHTATTRDPDGVQGPARRDPQGRTRPAGRAPR